MVREPQINATAVDIHVRPQDVPGEGWASSCVAAGPMHRHGNLVNNHKAMKPKLNALTADIHHSKKKFNKNEKLQLQLQ